MEKSNFKFNYKITLIEFITMGNDENVDVGSILLLLWQTLSRLSRSLTFRTCTESGQEVNNFNLTPKFIEIWGSMFSVRLLGNIE